MIETTTNPALRQIAETAHRERSLAAWRMIDAMRHPFAHRAARHEKRAARPDRPFHTVGLAA